MMLREGEQGVDVSGHPSGEMGSGKSVLAPSRYWKGQGSAVLPCARERNFRRF